MPKENNVEVRYDENGEVVFDEIKKDELETSNESIDNLVDDLSDQELASEVELEILKDANPEANLKKKHTGLLLTLLLLVLASAGAAYYFYQESLPIVIPEHASIKYFLNGSEVKEEDLLVDTEYEREVTNLDTGKTRKDKITFYDRTAPTISLLSDGSFNVQFETTNIYGLSVSDNYDDKDKIKVNIEGVEFDKIGEYDAVITATDTSGNIKKVSAIAKVVAEDLIVDGKAAKRDFSNYVSFDLDLRENPSEGIEFKQFKETNFVDVLSMIENKESFALYLYFNECPWCQDAMPILEKVAKDNDLTIYAINTRDALSTCSDACEINPDIKDIRQTKDENYLKWFDTTGQEKVTVPYLITYVNGAKEEDFFNINYRAPLRNINAEESKQLQEQYESMLSYLKMILEGAE